MTLGRVAFLIGLTLLSFTGASAQSESEKLPRFASFKSSETFMREGPSKENRLKWIYHRKGLPVEVLAKYEVWRRVRDADGEIGWVHVAMLSGDRTGLIIGSDNAPMREDESYGTPVVAEVQPGTIGELRSCGRLACRLTIGRYTGWVDRSRLYGVYVAETF